MSDWPIPSWPDKNRNRSPQRLVCRRSSPYPVPTCVSLSGMTLSEFRESLKAAEPPSGLASHFSDCGGMRKAIGREHTNQHSRRKVRPDPGCMPIYIARRATRRMRPIGTAEQADALPCQGLKKNGRKLRLRFWSGGVSSSTLTWRPRLPAN